jgi:hypothetical protein
MPEYNPDEWYTPEQALQKLKSNSGKETLDRAYLRSLARLGKIEKIRLGPNFSIYKKSDVDVYVVKGRGDKLPHRQQKELG